MELLKIKLGDIADIISGISFSPNDVCDKGIRVLRGGNIQGNRIILKEDDVFLPFEYQNSITKINVGDTILVASTGSVDVLGKAATCFTCLSDVHIGAFLRIIRPRKKEYAMLVSIAINSVYFRKYIKAQAKGTSINNITLGYLKEFEIYAPTNYTYISKLYSDIEKKIELNKQINDNLRASRAQIQTQFELCRGAAVNADISPNLQLLDRSLRVAITRRAA